MAPLLGSLEAGQGSVELAAGQKAGGGAGTITEVTSVDGSIVVTDPTGPVVDLSVANKTPIIVGKFTGTIFPSAGGARFSYMADPGQLGPTITANETSPQLYPTTARTVATMRAVAKTGTGTATVTATLYKNGAPTAQHVTFPGGSSPGAQLTDAGHPIAFANGDEFDVRLDTGASGDGPNAFTVVLEGPGAGNGGGGGGFSWLSTQLARAALLAPNLDTPWYTDLIINPGNNITGNNIEFAAFGTGSGSVVPDGLVPGGVYLLDTGATANSTANIGTPNAGTFILQNPAAGPFYAASRCKPIGTADGQTNYLFLELTDAAASSFIWLVGGTVGYALVMATPAGGSTVVSLATTLDPNARDFAVGFDGTTVTAFKDGVPLVSTTTLTNLPSTTLSIFAQVQNNATAASRQMLVDKLCCIQRSLQ